MREEVLAIFPTAARAKSIAERLAQNGANVTVVPGPDPTDPSYSVTVHFPDTPEGYRATTQSIEGANLSGVVSLPAPH